MRDEKLVKALRERAVSVIFFKKDGSARQMRCTLNEKLIPPDKIPLAVEIDPQQGVPVPREKPDKPDLLQKVFDLNIGEWRSFYYDRVTDWQ